MAIAWEIKVAVSVFFIYMCIYVGLRCTLQQQYSETCICNVISTFVQGAYAINVKFMYTSVPGHIFIAASSYGACIDIVASYLYIN